MERRRFLASAAATGPLIAGCQTLPGRKSSGRSGGHTDEVAPLSCPDPDLERPPVPFEEDRLRWATTFDDPGDPAFELRGGRTRYERGERATVVLENVSEERRVTGTRDELGLQVLTTDGWQEVRATPAGEPFSPADDAHLHPPGTGFRWTTRLTERGVVADPLVAGAEVCPGLPAGRYRFVYWGLDGAVAVDFDLEDPASD